MTKQTGKPNKDSKKNKLAFGIGAPLDLSKTQSLPILVNTRHITDNFG